VAAVCELRVDWRALSHTCAIHRTLHELNTWLELLDYSLVETTRCGFQVAGMSSLQRGKELARLSPADTPLRDGTLSAVVAEAIRSTVMTTVAPSAKSNGSTQDPLINEQALIAAGREGDVAAQRQLYEQHCQQVHRLMCRMVGANHADDLTQQVFLRVLQAIKQFRGESAFSTWLFRLATNEALQFLRRNGRWEPLALTVEPPDDKPSELRRSDDRDLLEFALANLDADLRAIFLLREVEQLSYYELAMVFDIAEGTVASRLNRARSLLRDLISPHQ